MGFLSVGIGVDQVNSSQPFEIVFVSIPIPTPTPQRLFGCSVASRSVTLTGPGARPAGSLTKADGVAKPLGNHSGGGHEPHPCQFQQHPFWYPKAPAGKISHGFRLASLIRPEEPCRLHRGIGLARQGDAPSLKIVSVFQGPEGERVIAAGRLSRIERPNPAKLESVETCLRGLLERLKTDREKPGAGLRD